MAQESRLMVLQYLNRTVEDKLYRGMEKGLTDTEIYIRAITAIEEQIKTTESLIEILNCVFKNNVPAISLDKQEK